MESILQHIQEILGVPAFLINQCTFIPLFIRDALATSVNFVPLLYFLYYAIELLERYFLTHINFFLKLIKRFGPFFSTVISAIPECGYSVITSTFYARKMITRGSLLAFLIACNDDALPLLFMDLSKVAVVIPIVIIKIVVGILVAFIVDLSLIFNNKTEKLNAVNIDLNMPGCCHHTIATIEHPPYWWVHPITHTFNVFMFTFLSLVFFNIVINGFGNVENLASFAMINSPLQVVAGAVIGLISNSVTSIFLALAFVKGIISFPTLLAGLITSTGIGLATLVKYHKNNADNFFITFILLITSIVTGLFVYYNMHLVSTIQNYF